MVPTAENYLLALRITVAHVGLSPGSGGKPINAVTVCSSSMWKC